MGDQTYKASGESKRDVLYMRSESYYIGSIAIKRGMKMRYCAIAKYMQRLLSVSGGIQLRVGSILDRAWFQSILWQAAPRRYNNRRETPTYPPYMQCFVLWRRTPGVGHINHYNNTAPAPAPAPTPFTDV